MRRSDIPSHNTAAIVILLVAHSGCGILSISGLAKDRRLSCPEHTHTHTHYTCRLLTRSLEVSGAAVAGEPRRCDISPPATPITLLRHRAHSISAKSETLSPVDLAPGLCARRNSKSSVDEASSRQWLGRGQRRRRRIIGIPVGKRLHVSDSDDDGRAYPDCCRRDGVSYDLAAAAAAAR